MTKCKMVINEWTGPSGAWCTEAAGYQWLILCSSMSCPDSVIPESVFQVCRQEESMKNKIVRNLQQKIVFTNFFQHLSSQACFRHSRRRYISSSVDSTTRALSSGWAASIMRQRSCNWIAAYRLFNGRPAAQNVLYRAAEPRASWSTIRCVHFIVFME